MEHLSAFAFRSWLGVAAGAILWTSAAFAVAQEPPEAPPPDAPSAAEEAPRPVEVVKARLVGTPGNRHVRHVRLLRHGGGRVDWAPQGDWIVFDEATDDGVYRLHLLDVANGAERCLTCDLYDLRDHSALSPVWHPSGEYVVFVGQRLPARMRPDAAALATPQRGLHGDLWVVTRDGKHAWQMTRIAENGGATVDPHFSFEADRLAWGERQESVPPPWGKWVVQVADFAVKRGLPRLGKLTAHRLEAPVGFVGVSGFSPDDRGVLVSVPAGRGDGDAGRDVARLDLASGALGRLTTSPDARDDLATPAPGGDLIVFVSDRNVDPPRPAQLPYHGDLWFRSPSDGREERLTFFNDPKSRYARAEALIDDLAWSPEGDRLLLHVVSVPKSGGEVVEGIWIVELDAEFQRSPQR